MNILRLQNLLKNFSDEQLSGEMQKPTGNVPQFLVLTEMQRRKDMRQDFSAAQAEQNQTTVAEDMMRGESAPGNPPSVAPPPPMAGLGALSQMPQQQPQQQPVRMQAGGMTQDNDYAQQQLTRQQPLGLSLLPDQSTPRFDRAGGGENFYDTVESAHGELGEAQDVLNRAVREVGQVRGTISPPQQPNPWGGKGGGFTPRQGPPPEMAQQLLGERGHPRQQFAGLFNQGGVVKAQQGVFTGSSLYGDRPTYAEPPSALDKFMGLFGADEEEEKKKHVLEAIIDAAVGGDDDPMAGAKVSDELIGVESTAIQPTDPRVSAGQILESNILPPESKRFGEAPVPVMSSTARPPGVDLQGKIIDAAEQSGKQRHALGKADPEKLAASMFETITEVGEGENVPGAGGFRRHAATSYGGVPAWKQMQQPLGPSHRMADELVEAEEAHVFPEKQGLARFSATETRPEPAGFTRTRSSLVDPAAAEIPYDAPDYTLQRGVQNLMREGVVAPAADIERRRRLEQARLGEEDWAPVEGKAIMSAEAPEGAAVDIGFQEALRQRNALLARVQGESLNPGLVPIDERNKVASLIDFETYDKATSMQPRATASIDNIPAVQQAVQLAEQAAKSPPKVAAAKPPAVATSRPVSAPPPQAAAPRPAAADILQKVAATAGGDPGANEADINQALALMSPKTVPAPAQATPAVATPATKAPTLVEQYKDLMAAYMNKGQDQRMSNVLLGAGAAMLGNKSPHFGQALGAGISGGMAAEQQYQKQLAEQQKAMMNLVGKQAELGILGQRADTAAAQVAGQIDHWADETKQAQETHGLAKATHKLAQRKATILENYYTSQAGKKKSLTEAFDTIKAELWNGESRGEYFDEKGAMFPWAMQQVFETISSSNPNRYPSPLPAAQMTSMLKEVPELVSREAIKIANGAGGPFTVVMKDGKMVQGPKGSMKEAQKSIEAIRAEAEKLLQEQVLRRGEGKVNKGLGAGAKGAVKKVTMDTLKAPKKP